MSYILPYIFLVFLSIRNNKRFSKLTIIFVWIFLVIFIGFRFEVGSDWNQYSSVVDIQGKLSFFEILTKGSPPLYACLILLCAKYNWGVYGLNLINAGIFSGGLVYFCSKLKNPLLGLIAAYPYLIIVVSMGFVTQAGAIGIQLFGLIFYQNKKFKLFYLSIFLASMLHSSGILCILIPIFDQMRRIKRKSSLISLSLIGLALGTVLFGFVSSILTRYFNSYIVTEYIAYGGFIKLLILSTFAIIFIFLSNKFEVTDQQRNLLYSLSILSILIFLGSLTGRIGSVSTYRTSLYFYSLILYVTSYLPYTNFLKISPKDWKVFFYLYNFLVLFVWINFSNHSIDWLPYKNILLENIL